MAGVHVEGIDHVHVHVLDREAAAAWYGRVLGLRRDQHLSVWAEDPRGPLMLAGAAGGTRIALFGNRKRGDAPGATVAFRVDGRAFLAFLAALPDLALPGGASGTLAPADVVDHDLAWSVYFCDPDGNHIEVTTYDHEQVAASLPPGEQG